MANSKRRGRHRASARPVTPFTGLGESISKQARRNVAAVASTGLAVTIMAIPGANATPTPVDAKSDFEKAEIKANPNVSVTDDTKWDMDAIAVDRIESREVTRNATDDLRNQGRNGQGVDSSLLPAAPAGSIMGEATRYIGVPYVYGGTTPAGFDCSGFVQYVYRQNGIELPRTSGAQASVGVPVSLANARPGDIVSWGYHSGIYAGNGTVLHASSPGAPLGYSPMWGGYTIRRVG
ncbi:C40 family peptidase [Actinomyces sp. zg-332]|uniref:C40 family peptidase n=1 Tax=Actinomyces sp. zg-332 TaxID=2708340 RepID=UPI001E3DF709|nr:C40 family peptidase [Actinomyces sp. zg-332]